MKEKLKNLIPSKRRLIQLYAALLTNANLKGFGSGKIYQGNVKYACAPGLNCYSCPGASAACPLGALQNALASTNTRAPYYVFGILILYGFLFGRWICGFLCPFGLIQDLLYKIKTPKMKKNNVTKSLSYLKYVILAVFVIAIPLIVCLRNNIALPAFCKYICPSGTLLGAVGLLSNESNSNMFSMLGSLFTWKFCLLVVIIVACIFIYRAFCRFLCPLGALYGLFNRISLLGMKLDKDNCVNCGLCVGKCKMDIRHVGDRECISCGDCAGVCPTGAITRKGPKILLAPNEVGGRRDSADMPQKLPRKTKIARAVVAAVMALILAGSLVYYNFIDKDPEVTVDPGSTSGSDLTYGTEVGNLCYSYDLKLVGSDGTVNVEATRGKITIINFWYTTCTPCVTELINEFPLILNEYGDQVTMLAVHSYGTADDEVSSFVAENLTMLDATYCFDGQYNIYYTLFGGGQSWPGTVILDGDGVIVSVITGPTTYEELKTIIDSILE